MSCVTLSFILMRIARITYYEIFHNSTIHWIQPVITCQTVIGIVMPVLLLLTIRAHKKKSNPIVPMGPVYHNDHYLKKEEFWESDEENLEYFNDIFAIDPKIFTLDHFRSSPYKTPSSCLEHIYSLIVSLCKNISKERLYFR